MPASKRFAQISLIGLMAMGSLVLWIVIPVAWILLASRMTDTTQPTLGPYLAVIVGIPVTMMIVGKLLARLNGVYGRVTGEDPMVRVQMPWHRSMRGEREAPRPRTMLDVVMVLSVSLALLVFGIWFFLFAGSSLPS